MENLPDEIIINIIEYLHIADIYNLMLTKRIMYIICNDKYVWFRLICRDFALIKFVNDKNYKSTYETIYELENTITHPLDIDIWKFMCTTISKGKKINWMTYAIQYVNYDISFFIECISKSQRGLKLINEYNTNKGKTLLHKAKTFEDTKSILDIVIDKNTFCLKKCMNDVTALHLAKNEYQTKLLLDSVNDPIGYCLMVTRDGCTALHLAKTAEQSKILYKCVSSSSYLNIEDHEGNTALHLAHNVKQTRTLLKLHPKNYGIKKNIYGYTALHLAKSTKQTKFLLEFHSKNYCMILDNYGQTPLFHYKKMKQIMMLLSYVQNPYSYCLIRNIYSRTIESTLSSKNWNTLKFMFFPE